MKLLCVGLRIGRSLRISGELNVSLTISTCNDSDSDAFLGDSQRHRWYPKRVTQVLGLKLRIALSLQP
jgi:hypothetical protein